MTGDWLPVTPATVEARSEALSALYGTLFPPEPTPPPQSVASIAPHGGDGPPFTDTAIFRMIGANPKYRALWRGDGSGYVSESEADLALCSYLAWATAGDAGRVARLFALSGLHDHKWADRADYRARTIRRALRQQVAA
jgi:primase-polymerase (primpol)-like protein